MSRCESFRQAALAVETLQSLDLGDSEAPSVFSTLPCSKARIVRETHRIDILARSNACLLSVSDVNAVCWEQSDSLSVRCQYKSRANGSASSAVHKMAM
ncbi:hypothetical protein QQF64_018775 [Cirrhinus molitorella]|uniref:Uncharacterized protein n=1 Tax=Cirrhinus molitorella TaxID=172907 RepID=A0ABR3LH14_9TELE